jgi:hypothetical protein
MVLMRFVRSERARMSAATLASGRIEQRCAAAYAHPRRCPCRRRGTRSFRPSVWRGSARQGQRRPSEEPLPSLSGVPSGGAGSAGRESGSSRWTRLPASRDLRGGVGRCCAATALV